MIEVTACGIDSPHTVSFLKLLLVSLVRKREMVSFGETGRPAHLRHHLVDFGPNHARIPVNFCLNFL